MAEQWIPNPAPYPPGPPTAWPVPGPPPPPGGPPPRQGRDATTVIVAVALAFAVLVVAGIGWAVVHSNDRAPTAALPPSTSTTTSTTTPPPTTVTPSTSPTPSSPSTRTAPSSPSSPSPPTTATPSALARVLPDLIAFVERDRGHRFRTAPVVQAIAADAFDAKLRANVDADRASIATEQVTDRALGLIKPGVDLFDVYTRLLAGAVVGFYDPATKKLYVEGETITPYRRTVIVHELTHALDDQYFDLQRRQAMERRPDESAFGFLSLIEGSAKRVENDYRKSLSAAEQGELADEEAKAASGIDILSFPLSLVLLQQIPYTAGEILTRHLEATGGRPLLDRSFRTPPATSEQVLDPSRYDRREPALRLTAPAADATVVDRGAFGVVDLQVTLIGSDLAGALNALDQPHGWGGGTYVSWRAADGRACVRFRVVGDTDEDTNRFRNELRNWGSSEAATVVDVTDPALPGRTVLEASRCA